MELQYKIINIQTIMKKTYKQPATNVVKVEIMTLLVNSVLGVGGTTNQNLSRHNNNIWDDDEDY